jgi:hypothetical protein
VVGSQPRLRTRCQARLPLVRFSAQPEPLLTLIQWNYPAYPTEGTYVEPKRGRVWVPGARAKTDEDAAAAEAAAAAAAAAEAEAVVGRCRLQVQKPVLKAPMVFSACN